MYLHLNEDLTTTAKEDKMLIKTRGPIRKLGPSSAFVSLLERSITEWVTLVPAPICQVVFQRKAVDTHSLMRLLNP